MSRDGSPYQYRLDARHLDSMHNDMIALCARLNDSMTHTMKEYMQKIDVVEDNAVDKIRDLEDQISRTVKHMTKEMIREKTSSMAEMKDLVNSFGTDMEEIEAKILKHSKAVAQRPAPASSSAQGGSGTSNLGS
eukprot:4736789-Karenia_brevis.AAC.1